MIVRRFFGGDGFEGRLAVRRHGGNHGAFVGGVPRIEHEDGDGLLHGGQDGGGVQNLGAEVGEFGGFLEADGFDAQGLGHDARVGGHNAVDVGPDFDGAGVQASSDEGGGVVAAAAPEGGGDAGFVGPDEAAEHGSLAGFDEGQHVDEHGGLDGGFEGRGLAVVGVGDDAGAGIDVGALEAGFEEGGGDHAGGHAFAEADDEVVGARGEFADGGDAAQQVVERVELLVERRGEGKDALARDELGGGVEVAFAELDGDGDGAGAVVFPRLLRRRRGAGR